MLDELKEIEKNYQKGIDDRLQNEKHKVAGVIDINKKGVDRGMNWE